MLYSLKLWVCRGLNAVKWNLYSLNVSKDICHTPVLWGLTGLWANVPWPFCCKARVCVCLCFWVQEKESICHWKKLEFIGEGLVYCIMTVTRGKLPTWQKWRFCRQNCAQKKICLFWNKSQTPSLSFACGFVCAKEGQHYFRQGLQLVRVCTFA